MKGIIVAGGLGTRLRPLTEHMPKPLLPIKGKPIIEHAISNLVKYGVKDIIISIGFNGEKIMEYFGNGARFGARISYSEENVPLGTGGALKLAARGIQERFILLWGDNLSDIDIESMLEEHIRTSAMITIALTRREDTENFGCAKLEGTRIIRFVEKPKRKDAPSEMINAGIFIIEPDAVKLLPEGRCSFEKDLLEKLCSHIGGVHSYIHKGQWFPTDTLEKYNHADDNFKPVM